MRESRTTLIIRLRGMESPSVVPEVRGILVNGQIYHREDAAL
jgi:hypothetical protein